MDLEAKPKDRPWILSVASGKGGVGKTLTTVNMALACRRLGLKTLILDGDFGMANVDVVLGLRSTMHLGDVLKTDLSVKDILLQGPLGVQIIPSGSGFAKLADLKLSERIHLLDKVAEAAKDFDLMIIDTGAGISSNVLHLNSISDEIMVITTPEPHALTDAYAFLKVMHEHYGNENFNVIINQASSEAQGLKIFQKISEVSHRFLGLNLRHGGTIPKDSMIERSIMMQRAADEQMSHTRSGQAWNEMTRRMLSKLSEDSEAKTRKSWQDLMFPAMAPRLVNAI